MRNSSTTYVARPDLLVLADVWGAHSSQSIADHLAHNRVRLLQIPRHTTGDIQPLDVGYFRQHKKFLKRVTEEAIYQDRIANVTSRDGIINVQGLIYNQLSASAYRDMLL